MKIDFLVTSTHMVGGVQTVLRQLSSALATAGHEVRVLSVVEEGAPGVIDLVRNAWWERLLPEPAWERLGLRRTRRLRIRRRAMRDAAHRLAAMTEGTSVLLVMDVVGAELAQLAAPAAALVIAHHNSYAAIAGTRDEQRLLAAASGADALVTLTEEDAAEFRRAGFVAGRIEAIPNAIERAGVRSVARTATGLVLAAGRFHPQKAFDVLLHAWAEVPDRDAHRLLLAGEGPDRRALARLRRTLGLTTVEISGPVDVREVLARADLFVLSSRDEGLPMVVLEAMSAGVPVVATDCAPGVRQLLVGPNAGVVVPVGDEAALAAAVDQCLHDERLRAELGRNGAREADRYGPERVVAQWERLFTAVADDRRGRVQGVPA